jgi:hypothetical protein
LGFFDSSILRFFDFCLDGGQEIEGGGRTDPTSILRFFDFSIIVWTGTENDSQRDQKFPPSLSRQKSLAVLIRLAVATHG